MKRITSVSDIKQLGTILSVWAHPDDESFLAAGVLAAAAQNEQRTICVTATKGEEGTQNPKKWPLDKISEIRTGELENALKILGIHDHVWLDYHDGSCSSVAIEEATEKIQKIIEKYKPDSILTFGADGWTGHEDHCTVHNWVKRAVKQSGKEIPIYCAIHTPEHHQKYFKPLDEELNFFFNVEEPSLLSAESCDIYFDLPKQICDIKCSALAASPSQTTAMFEKFDESFVSEAFGVECFVLSK